MLEKKKEDWMTSRWRPACGWMYILVCLFDFVIAPVLWSLLQALYKGGVSVQWQPLTLQGAGLFHISMGAVLGVAAYGRTQEKLAGANNGGLGAGTTYVPPAPTNGGFGNGNTTPPATGSSIGTTTPGVPSTGFSSAPGTSFTPVPSWGTTPTAPSGVGTPAPLWGAAPTADVTAGWGGKKAPPAVTDYPEK